jgi:flagellar assembly factor FliW
MMAAQTPESSDTPVGSDVVDCQDRSEAQEGGIGFRFPSGLIGFPSCTEFTLDGADIPGFYWLKATEAGPLAFLLVDPFCLMDEFFVDLPDTDLLHLETNHAPDVGVMAIVTLPAQPGSEPTANLQGILAFNFTKGIGRQVIIQDSPYGTRWPIDPERIRMAS